jgi:DMSO/TMAO reductase YedYZ molybdopterin-dependent catalytic subunit
MLTESEQLPEQRSTESPSIMRGIVVGVLSTFAGLAAAEVVTGLVRSSSSPILPVGQQVIDATPRSVRQWAIDTFGTSDKAVLVLGTLFSLAVIGSIVGILAVKGRIVAAYAVTVVVGLIGVWAVLERPAPTFGKLLPSIVGTLTSLAVLWDLAGRPLEQKRRVTLDGDASGPDVVPAGRVDVDRRRFVQSAATIGLIAALAAVVGRLLKGRFDVDEERAELQLPAPSDTAAPVVTVPASGAPTVVGAGEPTDFGLDGVTPWVVSNADFYRIDTALAVPQVPKDSWSLHIHGMVDREITLTFAGLLERPTIERYITLSCVSNEIGGDLVGNALFQGVRFKDVLDEAGVQPGATQVVSRSIDGWTCGSPTSVIMDGRDAMIAIAMNGEPLPPEHGYPVRLVVPGLYGYVSATKWVTEIELTRWEDFDGYWIPRGWAKEGPVKTMARIDRPRRKKSYSANSDGVIDIAGLAWAVHRGISKVEVSIDAGEWRECELAGVPSDDTWREWRYRWSGAASGDHDVRARAYDGAGEPQPEQPKSVAPDGAQGYHQVRFSVD